MNPTPEITVDEEGRLIVPAPLHQRLGLSAGTILVVEEESDAAAILRIHQEPSHLVDKGGVLVVRAEATASIADSVRDERARRVQSLLGRSAL